jgi:hypothetical protein
MSQNMFAKELVVLVADLDTQNGICGILERHRSLGIRELTEEQYDIHRHIQRDAGCRGNAEEFLRSFSQTHRYALVVFDRHGCGWEDRPATEIEQEVESRLTVTGWRGRCGVVVIDPELETWVWSDSPHVAEQLGWVGVHPSLQQWLVAEHHIETEGQKPADPKAAMLAALRRAGKPPSPRLFENLARQISLNRCADRAFLKLKSLLQQWFAA